MLKHGGNLRAASKKHNIPLKNWIDLSTGINPNGWPVPDIPASCWQRLPENADDLLPAAQSYYRNASILPVAGSQAAIQILPLFRSTSTVAVLNPAYAEHASNWQKAGHVVIAIDPSDIEERVKQLDVLILINPNNPTGQTFTPDQLLHWHNILQKRNGWLIIDEAFLDCSLEMSLANHPVEKGLIVLRSLGKFFGLAGIRCGFVISTDELLNKLDQTLGPWSISHPARYVATEALRDGHWQQQTRTSLALQAQRLNQLLSKYGLHPDGGSDLFQWIKTEKAEAIHQFLANRGILTRLFSHPSSLRFGLPKNNEQWLALEEALILNHRINSC